jgi:hypothetical protein
LKPAAWPRKQTHSKLTKQNEDINRFKIVRTTLKMRFIKTTLKKKKYRTFMNEKGGFVQSVLVVEKI